MRKQRAFLKWAGGKYSLVEPIQKILPQGKRLIEPFVGAGSVFLNTDYDHYLLNDINQDLINLYKTLQVKPEAYIQAARELFVPRYNQKDAYLELRQAFNQTTDSFERSVMFLYFNRHGYNGLCRYNRKGGFNVPFGRYKKPYFPEKELLFFAEKAQRATFVCESFTDTFQRSRSGDVVYCDPPYVPLSKTASFTSYAGNSFDLDDQAKLAKTARETAENKDVTVLISNHDTLWTREIYHGAQISELMVSRTISQNAGRRKKVGELMALYQSSAQGEVSYRKHAEYK